MKEFSKNLIRTTDTIEDVIRLIDSAEMKIAFVINEQLQLVGSVTDGDLRRAFLAGIKSTDSVIRIMNSKPKSVLEGTSKQVIFKIMKDNLLRFIPVVDASQKIVRIESLDEIAGLVRRNNHVILMAGGMGKRLSPLTDEVPKPLLHVGGKPILETIISNFQINGFHRITLSVNYKSQMIKDYFGDGSSFGVEIDYLDEEKPLGTCGAISQLMDRFDEPCIVMNGDILTNINFANLIDFHLENDGIGTMGVREYEFRVPYGVVHTDGPKILSIEEKPTQRFSVSAGIYVLSQEAIKLIPKSVYFDMPNLFNSLIESKYKTLAYPIKEYWMDIGRMDDFHRAQFEYDSIFK